MRGYCIVPAERNPSGRIAVRRNAVAGFVGDDGNFTPFGHPRTTAEKERAKYPEVNQKRRSAGDKNAMGSQVYKSLY
jgi:hypothetical protein